MLQNNTFNVINQLNQESKSLWRIKNEYLKDAEGCPDCIAFWEKMAKDKEEHIKELEALSRKYLSDNR